MRCSNQTDPLQVDAGLQRLLSLDDYIKENCSKHLSLEMMLFMLEQPDFTDCEDAKECTERFDEIKDCSLTYELL